MNTPWIIGTLLAIAFFSFFEWAAFKWPSRFNTLSHCIYTIGSKWPLSIFLMGMFCGGLAVHFFWHWCPDGSVSTGLMENCQITVDHGQPSISGCVFGDGAIHLTLND